MPTSFSAITSTRAGRLGPEDKTHSYLRYNIRSLQCCHHTCNFVMQQCRLALGSRAACLRWHAACRCRHVCCCRTRAPRVRPDTDPDGWRAAPHCTEHAAVVGGGCPDALPSPKLPGCCSCCCSSSADFLYTILTTGRRAAATLASATATAITAAAPADLMMPYHSGMCPLHTGCRSHKQAAPLANRCHYSTLMTTYSVAACQHSLTCKHASRQRPQCGIGGSWVAGARRHIRQRPSHEHRGQHRCVGQAPRQPLIQPEEVRILAALVRHRPCMHVVMM